MYNCEDFHIDGNVAVVTLIRETEAEDFGTVVRYDLNNRVVDRFVFQANQYTRRGKYLVGTRRVNIAAYPQFSTDVGDFRFQDWIKAGIRGNKRGCR